MRSPPTSPDVDEGHRSAESVNEPVAVRHDPGAGRSLSTTVVLAVATARDEDPVSLAPLNDVVDPDALDALCAGTRGGTISFTFQGCRVTVEDGTEVVVRPGDA